MKYEIDDDVWLVYKGQKLRVLESLGFRKAGTLAKTTTVFVLENGKHVLPAHFRYGLADLPPGANWFMWHLNACMPRSAMRETIADSKGFFIAKDSKDLWQGATIEVPLVYSGNSNG